MKSTLLVLLVRHAEREYFSDRQDWEQPLTDKGQRTAQALGENLQQRLASQAGSSTTAIIFTSPFLRCKQTAAILATYLKPKAGVQEVEALSLTPDETGLEAVQWTLTLLASASNEEGCVVLVGHQPELEAISERLCSTGFSLKKCEAAALKLEAGLWQNGQADLLWRLKGKH